MMTLFYMIMNDDGTMSGRLYDVDQLVTELELRDVAWVRFDGWDGQAEPLHKDSFVPPKALEWEWESPLKFFAAFDNEEPEAEAPDGLWVVCISHSR